MKMFPLLALLDSAITPVESKIHLASSNGETNPLEVFFEGGFEAWQARQSKKNFQRKYVVSLIALPETGQWLFAGCFSSHGCREMEVPNKYWYELTRRVGTSEMEGRLLVDFQRNGRQSYLNAETWAENMFVAGIRLEGGPIS